ncbi:hypothetical protein SASPL_125928 [Salvia splendens]|uniref:Uncharacterized protein n=1 Tax=Salvia splendens TaxID=180675 RepID=A0A8X8XKW7_SALSN|nr:hypothetical protein SASPL_125928 [Salvia splendens]
MELNLVVVGVEKDGCVDTKSSVWGKTPKCRRYMAREEEHRSQYMGKEMKLETRLALSWGCPRVTRHQSRFQRERDAHSCIVALKAIVESWPCFTSYFPKPLPTLVSFFTCLPNYTKNNYY